MAEISGETAGLVGGIVTVLGVLGGGIRWAVTARATQQKMVDDAVERVVGGLRKDVKQLRGQVALLTNGCTMLMGEVARHAPDSPTLREAQRLFNLAFALPESPPDAIADLMDELHERTK